MQTKTIYKSETVKIKYHIYLMGFVQSLIFITSYYISSKLLVILFQSFKLLMLVESRIRSKNHGSCNLKYYIKVLFRRFTKTLNQFFFIYIGYTNLWKVACLFDLSN